MVETTSSAEPRSLQVMTLLVLLTLCVSLTEAGGLYRIYQGYDLQPCPMTSVPGTYTKSRCVLGDAGEGRGEEREGEGRGRPCCLLQEKESAKHS